MRGVKMQNKLPSKINTLEEYGLSLGLNSVLSLAVYLRIVVPMYQQGDTETSVIESNSISLPLTSVVWVIAFLFTLAIGLAAQGILGKIVGII